MRKLIIVIVMGFLSNIFSSCKTTEQINSYADFWSWFEKNEKNFLKIVEKSDSSEINERFFEPLSKKLNELKDGYYFLVGMDNASTAELIITTEGVIKNFVFVEELVAAAPNLPNWKFTALKPALNIENVNIEMNGYKFGSDNLYFYSNDNPDFPDEVDITIVYSDFKEEDRETIISGIYVFIDNYLGELYSATTIDYLNIIGIKEIKKELIPIEKLKSYLILL